MGGDGSDAFDLEPVIRQEFPAYYDKLVNSQPIRCFQTKKIFDEVQKPTAVVLDVGATCLKQHQPVTVLPTSFSSSQPYDTYVL